MLLIAPSRAAPDSRPESPPAAGVAAGAAAAAGWEGVGAAEAQGTKESSSPLVYPPCMLPRAATTEQTYTDARVLLIADVSLIAPIRNQDGSCGSKAGRVSSYLRAGKEGDLAGGLFGIAPKADCACRSYLKWQRNGSKPQRCLWPLQASSEFLGKAQPLSTGRIVRAKGSDGSFGAKPRSWIGRLWKRGLADPVTFFLRRRGRAELRRSQFRHG